MSMAEINIVLSDVFAAKARRLGEEDTDFRMLVGAVHEHSGEITSLLDELLEQDAVGGLDHLSTEQRREMAKDAKARYRITLPIEHSQELVVLLAGTEKLSMVKELRFSLKP